MKNRTFTRRRKLQFTVQIHIAITKSRGETNCNFTIIALPKIMVMTK